MIYLPGYGKYKIQSTEERDRALGCKETEDLPSAVERENRRDTAPWAFILIAECHQTAK
jgi:hypothetical protein